MSAAVTTDIVEAPHVLRDVADRDASNLEDGP